MSRHQYIRSFSIFSLIFFFHRPLEITIGIPLGDGTAQVRGQLRKTAPQFGSGVALEAELPVEIGDLVDGEIPEEYAGCVTESDFGRLSVVRSPPKVMDAGLLELVTVLNVEGGVIGLDEAGRLVISYEEDGLQVVKTTAVTGTSVADADRIKAVASRAVATQKAGKDVVVVVSAMGKSTDELIVLASDVTSRSHPREMDMLLTAGERISMALLAMALHEVECRRADQRFDLFGHELRVPGIEPGARVACDRGGRDGDRGGREAASRPGRGSCAAAARARTSPDRRAPPG